MAEILDFRTDVMHASLWLLHTNRLTAVECLVLTTGLAPWAVAHGKQWVSTVLSAVDSADFPPLKSCIISQEKHSNLPPYGC